MLMYHSLNLVKLSISYKTICFRGLLSPGVDEKKQEQRKKLSLLFQPLKSLINLAIFQKKDEITVHFCLISQVPSYYVNYSIVFIMATFILLLKSSLLRNLLSVYCVIFVDLKEFTTETEQTRREHRNHLEKSKR